MKRLYDIVVFGPQGSGKGTQSEILAKRLHIPAVSVGQLWREEIAKHTELGVQAESIVATGGLVPPELTTQIVYERMMKPDASEGLILDGYPRFLAQLESHDKILDSLGRELTDAILLKVSDELSVARLAGRRSCTNAACGANFHLEFQPPQQPNVCDRCGAPLAQREDDVPDAIKRRLGLYHKETEPLTKVYEERGILRVIDGSQSIDNVAAQIAAALHLEG